MGYLAEGGQVNRRGEDVVGRLAHVHVVVRMGVVAREVGDHLVGVRVRRGAGPGLEDIDRELVVVLAGGDLVGGRGDALAEIGVEEAKLGIHPRRRRLDPPQPMDDRHRDRLAGDGKVGDRLRGLLTPQPRLDPGRSYRPSP